MKKTIIKENITEQNNNQIEFLYNVFGLNAELYEDYISITDIEDEEKANLIQFLSRSEMKKYNQNFNYKLVNTKYGKRYVVTVEDSDEEEKYTFWFRTFTLIPVYSDYNTFLGILVKFKDIDSKVEFTNNVASDTMEEAFTKNSFMKIKKW